MYQFWIRFRFPVESSAEVNYLLGDSGKALKKLGWESSTSLEELVSEMIDKDTLEAEQEKSFS